MHLGIVLVLVVAPRAPALVHAPTPHGLIPDLGQDVEGLPVHGDKLGEPGLDAGLIHDVLVLVVALVLGMQEVRDCKGLR